MRSLILLRPQLLSALLSVSLLTICLGPFPAHSQGKTMSAAEQKGGKIFREKCTGCHTIGKGKLVGPDLSGVTRRREEGWLRRQIKTPQEMIAELDPIVMQLLKESNNVPMVPLGLTDEEVESVIAYFKRIEQEASVAAGVPSQYVPTVLISMLVLIGFTVTGLRAGNKKVDVR